MYNPLANSFLFRTIYYMREELIRNSYMYGHTYIYISLAIRNVEEMGCDKYVENLIFHDIFHIVKSPGLTLSVPEILFG